MSVWITYDKLPARFSRLAWPRHWCTERAQSFYDLRKRRYDRRAVRQAVR